MSAENGAAQGARIKVQPIDIERRDMFAARAIAGLACMVRTADDKAAVAQGLANAAYQLADAMTTTRIELMPPEQPSQPKTQSQQPQGKPESPLNIVVAFPCDGGQSEFRLTVATLECIRSAFRGSGIDVGGELMRFRTHLETNPKFQTSPASCFDCAWGWLLQAAMRAALAKDVYTQMRGNDPGVDGALGVLRTEFDRIFAARS